MAAIGEDIIGSGGVPPFFKVANADEVTIKSPANRKGDALRTWVRSLSGFQKEALVRSARTGETWRLVSDEGPYLNGHDAAPCPLAFLSTGMAASFMNEIIRARPAAGHRNPPPEAHSGQLLHDERLHAETHHGWRRGEHRTSG